MASIKSRLPAEPPHRIESYHLKLGRGLTSTVHHYPDVPGSELQVVHRPDGTHSVATFNLPDHARGQHLGQHLLLHALRQHPIDHKPRGTDNLTDAAWHVRQSLLDRGHAELKTDEYGRTAMHLKADPVTKSKAPAQPAAQPSALATRAADIDARLLQIAQEAQRLHGENQGRSPQTPIQANQQEYASDGLSELVGRIRFGDPEPVGEDHGPVS